MDGCYGIRAGTIRVDEGTTKFWRRRAFTHLLQCPRCRYRRSTSHPRLDSSGCLVSAGGHWLGKVTLPSNLWPHQCRPGMTSQHHSPCHNAAINCSYNNTPVTIGCILKPDRSATSYSLTSFSDQNVQDKLCHLLRNKSLKALWLVRSVLGCIHYNSF